MNSVRCWNRTPQWPAKGDAPCEDIPTARDDPPGRERGVRARICLISKSANTYVDLYVCLLARGRGFALACVVESVVRKRGCMCVQRFVLNPRNASSFISIIFFFFEQMPHTHTWNPFHLCACYKSESLPSNPINISYSHFFSVSVAAFWTLFFSDPAVAPAIKAIRPRPRPRTADPTLPSPFLPQLTGWPRIAHRNPG